MPAKVTLTVTNGQLETTEFVFAERMSCMIGKASECYPLVPSTTEYETVSRHHCMVDINPPDISVRDAGSLNGTFVNGTEIGRREADRTGEQATRLRFPAHSLKDGDEFWLTKTKKIGFRVGIFVPLYCAECEAEITEEQRAESQIAPGVYRCQECRERTVTADDSKPLGTKPKTCANCGRNVSQEEGANRPGEFVCMDCREGLTQVIRALIGQAEKKPAEGPVIQGYEILKELRRGGFGAIYLANHVATNQPVALKVMLPEVAADKRAVDDFLREMENTKALRHPHIIEMRDWGFSNGIFFFTMEYCQSGSLADLLRAHGGPLPAPLACHFILQALDGLTYAHQAEIPFVKLKSGRIDRGHGLVHRDISPENILLSGEGNSRVAKVSDFGIAKAFDWAGLSNTRSTTAMGKPRYLPRQQRLFFKYVGPEVDIWATAATLYYLLTGRPPRDFPLDKDPWKVVLNTKPIPILERSVPLPSPLAKVIDLALVDDPEIIVKTASDFKQRLERVL